MFLVKTIKTNPHLAEKKIIQWKSRKYESSVYRATKQKSDRKANAFETIQIRFKNLHESPRKKFQFKNIAFDLFRQNLSKRN